MTDVTSIARARARRRLKPLAKVEPKLPPASPDAALNRFRARRLGIRLVSDNTARCSGCRCEVRSDQRLGIVRRGEAVMLYCLSCTFSRQEQQMRVEFSKAGMLLQCDACDVMLGPDTTVARDHVNRRVTCLECMQP